jgi:hypothetical protein
MILRSIWIPTLGVQAESSFFSFMIVIFQQNFLQNGEEFGGRGEGRGEGHGEM